MVVIQWNKMCSRASDPSPKGEHATGLLIDGGRELLTNYRLSSHDIIQALSAARLMARAERLRRYPDRAPIEVVVEEVAVAADTEVAVAQHNRAARICSRIAIMP